VRVLFLGDVVGRSGRDAVKTHLPELKSGLELDFVVVNGENAAGGFGITRKICEEFFALGIDVITTGNHVWAQTETLGFIDQEKRLLRPHNYPPGTPGTGAGTFVLGDGRKVTVINLLGRVFMEALDDPFAALEAELATVRLGAGAGADFILVDLHCEASSEKTALGCVLDGRVSAAIGSHTHVPSADARILPGGTAYQSDAGMCGDYDSVIGMVKDEPIRRFQRKIPGGRFAPALGPGTLCGVFIESDDASGLARRIAPVRLGGQLQAALPEA
jgi:hypothetical protein